MRQFRVVTHFVILLALITSFQLAAKVSMSVDRTDISAGETFVLDIRVDGDTDAQPDLSLIPKEFTIVSNSQYHHSQFINGRQSTLKGWKIKLKTLQKGPITIPSITVGNDSTKPIQLNIKDSSNQLDMNGESKLIFLEANAQQEEAYVQEQVIFTVSLYRAVNTHYASLSDPSANNSIIEKLGDDIQFEKYINKRRYIVTQRKYAIFPQESGELTISPVNFSADVNDNSRRSRNSFLSSTRPISLSTEAIKLAIKPKPVNAPVNWLPATDVTLVDQWKPNNTTLKVGEPATWTLLLSVEGLSESQLPELQIPAVDGLQWYYDSPQKERQITDNGIKGQRVEKLAVIPSKAGEITIPEIKLDWWDVKSDSLKTAILETRTITVEAAAAPVQAPQIPAPVVTNTFDHSGTQSSVVSNRWMYFSFLLMLLWLITLVAYFQQARKRENLISTEKSSNRMDSVTEKEAFRQLKSTLNSKTITDIESALLGWLQASGYASINSLNALAKRLKSSNIVEKIHRLDQARYSASQHEVFPGLDKSDLETIRDELAQLKRNTAFSGDPPALSALGQ